MKTVDRGGIVSSSSTSVVKATFWTGLGGWKIVVTVFEDVIGGITDSEFTGNTTAVD